MSDLKKLGEKANQAVNRLEEYKKNEALRLRKKRNHDLIVLGGIVCQFLGRESPQEDDAGKLYSFLSHQEDNGYYFTKWFGISEDKASHMKNKRKSNLH